MSWINTYQKWLSESESLKNAQKVVDYLYTDKKDWSKESISALIGNMRHESSINPNMYEYGFSWGEDRGFGLVQWTPRSKYWNWGSSKGYSESELRNGDAQLERIDFEVDNNIQWIPKESNFNGLTFKQFRTNSKKLSVSELTEAFTWGYERPNAQAGAESMPARKAFANKAFNDLKWDSGGGGGGKPDPDPDPDPEPEPEPEIPELDFSGVLNLFEKLGKDFMKAVDKMLTVDLYDYGNRRNFGNSFIKANTMINNMYQIKPTINFTKALEKIINDGKKELDKVIDSIVPEKPDPDPEPEPDPDPDPDPDPPSDDKFLFPVKIQNGINFWAPPYVPNSTQDQMEYGHDRGTHIHIGYDIGGGGVNHNIYAIRSGKVTHVGNDGDRGQNIIIKHSSDSYHSRYQHLVVGSQKVKKGDTVKAGQLIAKMGNSPGGYSIHLHIEISKNGTFNFDNTINPRPYLKVTGNNKTSLKQP